MTNASALYSGLKVGQVVSGILLDKFSPTEFIPADGLDRATSVAPIYAAQIPVGVMTSTARTLTDACAGRFVRTDGTNFIISGAGATSPLQASLNGSVYSVSATWTAATASDLLIAGSRLILIGTGTDLDNPQITATGQTAAAVVAKANWSVTSGVGYSQPKYGAYSNSLGRAVIAIASTGTQRFSLENVSTVWASSGSDTSTPQAVVWDGTVFVIFTTTTLIQVSATGLNGSWTNKQIPIGGFAVQQAVSDGNGTIVAVGLILTDGAGVAYGWVTSKDHGVTWSSGVFPEAGYASSVGINGRLSVANGKFIATLAGTVAKIPAMFSTDGEHWHPEPIQQRGVSWIPVDSVAYLNSVYLGVSGIASGTSALTAIEDTTKFRTPRLVPNYLASASGILPAGGDSQYFIKVT